MATGVITIAQQKGGSGKTTLAIQLAVALHGEGREVALLDIDPQGSVGGWQAQRQARAEASDGPAVESAAGWRTEMELRRLRGAHDIVIVDSAPHAETEARVAVRACDLLLVPCQPSLLDLWATRPTLSLAAGERKPFLLVLNRVPPRGRQLAEVTDAIAAEGLPLARTTLGNRTAFATSIGRGQGVVESEPRSVAADEVRALAAEVLARLG